MNNKKKLLYVMGIDWDWIFQRPQIMEQHLEENYDVTVVFPRSILKAFHKSHTKYPADYKILWTLPLQEKNRFIGWLSSLYSRHIFSSLEQYDAVMLGYPLYYRYVDSSYNGTVIYDCMDNHEALYPDQRNVEKIKYQEKALINRSNVVLVTAEKLLQKIQSIAPDKNIFLIRNGTENEVLSTPECPCKLKHYKIGYFGTIAEWFDYDVLLQSLEVNPDVEYHLIGPVQKQNLSTNSQIYMEGIVAHNRLHEYVKDYSCLIMPFKINAVVEWVDPVKLYEYISMGKCIISVRYAEIERFHDYIYMYSDTQEFLSLLKDLKESGFPPKYTKEQQETFLKENSWENRFKQLDNILENLL